MIEELKRRIERLERRFQAGLQEKLSAGPEEDQCEAKAPADRLAITPNPNLSGRRTARHALSDTICSLRERADLLEALAGALPNVLTPQLDQALWMLLSNQRP